METTENKHTDLTYLKQLSNGDNEFIHQMITIFMTQTPDALDSIDMYLKEKNWKSLKGIAHKMKPSFSFMGIKELEPVILLVEEYCENETHLDQLPKLTSTVRRICELAIIELETEKKRFKQ